MLGHAGSSMALFAAVWGLLCILSSALVTDAGLRDSRSAPAGHRGGRSAVSKAGRSAD